MRAALIVVLLVGCGTESAPSSEPGAGPAPTGTDIAVDEPPSPSAAWPDEVTSLRDQLEAFTDVGACRRGLRERTPTAVAEGLADLHYDAFFDDVCAGLAAAKAGSVEGCDAIGPSPARAGCRLRLALVHGRPDACPDARLVGGRDPVCLAWASRDPALCRGAQAPDAIRCRAVLADDPDLCGRLPEGDRGRCAAEVARYASAIPGEREGRTLAPAVMELELRSAGGETETIRRDVLERGVAVRVEGCRARLALEHPHGERRLTLGLGRREGTFRLELVLPLSEAPPVTIPLDGSAAVLTSRTPSRGGLSSISGATGAVTLTAFEPHRGGAIEGTIAGTLRAGTDAHRIRGRFATFVRDLEPITGCSVAEAP